MSEYIKIEQVDPSLPTVIAFSQVNIPKGRFKPYRSLKSGKVNLIFVNDNGNRWYQSGIPGVANSSAAAAEILVSTAKEIGNGKVVTFGSSMGGFGAILFAILGRADGCLAFGVESRLGLAGGRSLKDIPSFDGCPHGDLTCLLANSEVPVCVLSPEADEVDMKSAMELKECGVECRSILGVEHPGVQAYGGGGQLAELIASFAESLVLPDFLDRTGGLLDRLNFNAVEGLYEAFLEKQAGDVQAGLSRLKIASATAPGAAIVKTRLGEAYQATGEIAEANRCWLQAVEMCEYQFEAHSKLGANLRRSGEHGDALFHLQEAVKINPFAAHSHHTLGLLHKDLGDHIECERSLRRAVSINHGNRGFSRSLFTFLLEDVDRKTAELRKLSFQL